MFMTNGEEMNTKLEKMGAYVITSGDHLTIARDACEAGARIIQYRDKGSSRKEMVAIARQIRALSYKSGTLFVINDFIDIALIVGADGVHLGQDDISIGDARNITPQDFIIGISTHSLEQALIAEKNGADYIGIGPVFATPTKEHYMPIGVDTVKEVSESVKIPFVAIGGLNLQNIDHLRTFGAVNFAMVREYQLNTASVITKINSFL